MPTTVTDALSSLSSIGIGSITLASIIPAVLIAIVSLIAIRLLSKLFAKMLGRSKLDKRVQRMVLSAIRLAMYMVALLIVLDSLGIPITSLVAIFSLCSLGITLAAEDVLGNLAGGLVIVSSRPFVLGDVIEASGTMGTVEEITLNHTKLITPDGLLILLPNKDLSVSKLINYTSLGKRRVTQVITASYDAPTDTVKAACNMALDNTPLIVQDPPSAVYLTNYGESSIEYTVYCWCEAQDYLTVKLALGEALRPAFAHYNVEMTYNHLNVHIVQPS